MSYSAFISFKKIPPEMIPAFFQDLKKAVLERMDDIAERDYPYCPLVRENTEAVTPERSYGDAKTKFREAAVRSNLWFHSVFTFRWFYEQSWGMLGVYGIPEPVRDLFDGTVYFQDSTDQNYDRNDWGGIQDFQIIYDQWVSSRSDRFVLNRMKKINQYEPGDENNPERILYCRKYLAYHEIWDRIEHTLVDDDNAVYVSLFSDTYDILTRKRFLQKCFVHSLSDKT